jgi:hypothetical protein
VQYLTAVHQYGSFAIETEFGLFAMEPASRVKKKMFDAGKARCAPKKRMSATKRAKHRTDYGRVPSI